MLKHPEKSFSHTYKCKPGQQEVCGGPTSAGAFIMCAAATVLKVLNVWGVVCGDEKNSPKLDAIKNESRH